MLSERDIVAKVQHITVTRLRVWVRQGWIRPAAKAKHRFSEADMARAAQIHGLRSELKAMLEALDELPEDLRATVKVGIAKRKGRRR